MTTAEKIIAVKALLRGDSSATDALVEVYLADAKSAVLRRLYPFGIPASVTDVPAIYEMLQVKLAVRYFNRAGGEGEVGHSENGIQRTYGSVNDEDLLKEITPYCKMI